MTTTSTAHVIRANSRTLPIADDTVDLVVTSPPYFALRSYQDGGEHYAGQIGDEPTPSEFVDSLLEVTAECVRVLKPSGSLWVNLGDKYATYAGNRSSGRTTLQGATDRSRPIVPRHHGLDGGGQIQAKSLMGIPWRYALRCIDDLGLILRAEVIWSKPNGLPESVTDRVRRSHEQWFHFTLNPRYYSAVDEIREPQSDDRHTRTRHARTDKRADHEQRYLGTRESPPQPGEEGSFNPLGKLPGSVWTVPTEPLRVPDYLDVDHFAAFPTEWPKRIVQGWSPAGVCTVCGQGRRPVTLAEYDTQGRTTNGPKNEIRKTLTDGPDQVAMIRSGVRSVRSTSITGYACCCPEPDAPTRPGVVLDPFGGTGTTAMVAKALGRTGISVDMSADYCRLAQWRTNDRNQLAKVLGHPKIDAPDTDQLSLLD